jgi:hypothetical protein
MHDLGQAVHLTKRTRHSCLIVKLFPEIMPSTAVTVAGIAAHVFRSNDVVQSRLSTQFVRTHIPRKSRSSVVQMVVSASLNLTSFTCVLEFVLDPSLHRCDTVLGLDWSWQCQNAETLSLVLSLECLDGVTV